MPNKRILLDEEVTNPVKKVEKSVYVLYVMKLYNRDGFKLVALPKKTNTSVGKKIDSKILNFQQSHFYGKQTKRVSSSSFNNHKTAKTNRRQFLFF